MTSTSAQRDNRFLAVVHWEQSPIRWDPYDETQEPFPGYLYYARILQQVDRLLPGRGLTFIVTSNLNELPEYGDAVVALVREDEWCRVPAYASRVRAVFKTYGTKLPWVAPQRVFPTYLEAVAALQNARTVAKTTPFALRSLARRRFASRTVYDMPLGYFKQLDMPYRAMKDRRLDVSFQGSLRNKIHSKLSPRYWLRTPKTLSRERLFAYLDGIRRRHPALALEFELTKNFWDVGVSEAERFSRTMMETRVCIVPRGTSLETYRYFEALRYGCIVVAEGLPHRSYYDGAPIVRVADWSQLEKALLAIVDHPELHDDWSRRSLAWWNDHASEPAVARYIAARI